MDTWKNKAPLWLAILFSFSFHFIALAGFKGFSLVNPVAPVIFFANLESDTPQQLPLPTPMKNSVHVAAGKAQRFGLEALTGGREDLSAPVEKGDDARPAEEDRNTGSLSGTQGDIRADESNGEGEGNQERTASGREEKRDTLPRHFREKLYYELYWLGIYVGNATFEAVNDNGEMKITSRVHSAPVVSAFYEVEDYAESRIIDGAPVHFRIMQHEGKYRSNKETIFDPTEKKVIFFNHLKETRDEHAMPGTALWDVISAFYYLRTQPLETGKTISLAVFDSNKFLNAEVFVLGKERLEAFDRNGTDTVIVRPVLKSEGLFKNQGTILVWLTDDEHKVPVKVETEVPVGKVVARLAGRESD